MKHLLRRKAVKLQSSTTVLRAPVRSKSRGIRKREIGRRRPIRDVHAGKAATTSLRFKLKAVSLCFMTAACGPDQREATGFAIANQDYCEPATTGLNIAFLRMPESSIRPHNKYVERIVLPHIIQILEKSNKYKIPITLSITKDLSCQSLGVTGLSHTPSTIIFVQDYSSGLGSLTPTLAFYTILDRWDGTVCNRSQPSRSVKSYSKVAGSILDLGTESFSQTLSITHKQQLSDWVSNQMTVLGSKCKRIGSGEYMLNRKY